MDSTYEHYPIVIPEIAPEEAPSEGKVCPGLQRFCPHYMSTVCDVKHSECILLNSLKTSEMILCLERELLLKNPTPNNLTLVAQINDVLQETHPDMTIDPAAILRAKRKGRLVAFLFLLIIVAVAVLISIT